MARYLECDDAFLSYQLTTKKGVNCIDRRNIVWQEKYDICQLGLHSNCFYTTCSR